MILTIRAARLRAWAALFALFAIAFSLNAGSYSWTTTGPEPGMIIQVVVNPQDSNRMLALAGYYGQMLFRTSDRGVTWVQEESLLYAGRLVQDPANANGLYTIGLSSTFYGVMKSLDGGATWSPAAAGIPTSLSVSVLAAAPSAPNTLYAAVAGSPGQVFRSLDGAASWERVSNAFPSAYVGDLAVDPAAPGTLYAEASPGLLKSIDAGATWAPVPSVPNTARIFLRPGVPTTIYVTTSDAGVSKSTDGGLTWQPANGGIADHYVRDLAFDPANSQRLYGASNGSATSLGGLFVTTNGGQDWLPVDFGTSVNVATAVAVDPRNAALVYAGAGLSVLRGSIFASPDGGTTWALREKGLSGYYSYAVAGDPTQGAGAYCVSGPRVYRTDDHGGAWTLRGASAYGLTSLVVDPSGADTLYAGYGSAAGNGVVKSVDGGASWNPATNGLSTALLHRLVIAPTAPDHLLASSQDGLFGTVDGGGLWSPLLSGDVRAAGVDPADASILYAGLWSSAPTADGLLRSPDGGATWGPPSGLPTSYPHVADIAIARSDPSRVYTAFYAGGTGQGIYRSADRGLSFSPAAAGLAAGFWPTRLVADPSNAQTLYVFGEPNGGAAQEGAAVAAPTTTSPRPAYWSRDGAGSWVALPGFLPSFGILDVGIGADGRTLYASTLSGAFQFRRSFLDVPDADPFWSSVDAAAMNGVTAGCGSGNYCPGAPTSRAAVAVFLLRGKYGATYAPPPATGAVFGDVAAGSPAADFIEELFHQGTTAGCGAGNYCPGSSLSRAEAAVLLLKTMHGSSWVPPAATGDVFADVPADAFAAAWIEELFAEGITAGCGGGNFCPGADVSRAQAAALVVRAFGLS